MAPLAVEETDACRGENAAKTMTEGAVGAKATGTEQAGKEHGLWLQINWSESWFQPSLAVWPWASSVPQFIRLRTEDHFITALESPSRGPACPFYPTLEFTVPFLSMKKAPPLLPDRSPPHFR